MNQRRPLRAGGAAGRGRLPGVCAPLVGGAVVDQWVAHELAPRSSSPHRSPGPSRAGRATPFRRRRTPRSLGKRAVVDDDAINAGSATLACVREVAAVAQMRERFGLPVESALAVHWNTWAPRECPLCRSGVALAP